MPIRTVIPFILCLSLCVGFTPGCDAKKRSGIPPSAPQISDIYPGTITYGSNTKIRINGAGFFEPLAVAFGNSSATEVFLDTTASIVATPPLLEPGVHDVTVMIVNFKSTTLPGALKVLFPGAPQITTVTPNQGPETGGTAVSITGSGFYAGALVFFGNTAAAVVSVDNETHITATTPAHAQGVVDVTVTNIDGQEDILTGGFTFYFPNEAPVAVPVTPADPSSRIVDFGFTLSDSDNATADVTIEYSTDGGNSWHSPTEWSGGGPASSGTSGLASGGGASHTFRWNAFADLGKTTATVLIRITAHDGLSSGAPAVSAAFGYIAPPILQAVAYIDWTGDGDVSENDELLLIFDEAVQLQNGSGGPLVLASGTEFAAPVSGDSTGMNAFLLDPSPGDSEISLILGGGAVFTPDGVFDSGNTTAGAPSGLEIGYDLGDYITGAVTGNAMSFAPHDIAGETTIAGHLAVLALPGLKISCNAAGVYVVSEADFIANGVPTGFPSVNLRMFYRGKEVPIRVLDGGNGIWDAGDTLHFYSRGYEDYYTDGEAYFLVADGSVAGLRIGSVGGVPTGTCSSQTDFPRTVRYEDNYFYVGNRPVWDGDPWVGDIIFSFWPPTNYIIDLPAVSGSTGNAFLSVGLQGGDDDTYALPHKAEVSVNAVLQLDLMNENNFAWFSSLEFSNPARWDAYESGIGETSFPQSLLSPGPNTVTVSSFATGLPGWDVVYTNFIEITYNSSYIALDNRLEFSCRESGDTVITDFVAADIDCWRVTDPDSPEWVVGGVLDGSGTYKFYQSGVNDYVIWSIAATPAPDVIEPIVYEDLHATATQADYIMITHPDFSAAAATLKTHREGASGGSYAVKIVDVNAVYNEFDFGRVGPGAIRNFLNYAYYRWQAPRPEFVLLFGDATEDPKNESGLDAGTYIPATKVITLYSSAPCDFPYADITGTDYKPDFCVGRLPVRHIDNANTIVSKTINYELAADTGTWEKRVLHVSDNADGAGDFPTSNTQLISDYVSGPYIPQHLWIGGGGGNEANASTITAAMNDGRLLVTYLGHGLKNAWASEVIFNDSDVPLLTNGDNTSVIIAFNCINGYFTGAEGFLLNVECLAELFLEHPGGGSVACWACSGLNYFPGQYVLAQQFHDGYYLQSERCLGRLTRSAIDFLVDQGVSQSVYDIVHTYVIFGDPALTLK